MPFANASDGVSIYYETHGEGQPIIFIHGGGGNTLVWYQQVPYFSRKHKVITVDLRGFKHSVCSPDRTLPQHFSEDMLSVLDHAGVEKAVFACQSLGAWAGLPVAVHHPERVQALFISGSPTPAYSPRTWKVLEDAARTFDYKQADMRANGIGWNKANLESRPEMLFLYSQLKGLNPSGFRAETMTADEVRILPEHFRGYAIPTMVCGGSHDDFLTPTLHEDVARIIPGASAHTFVDAGHSAYFETPDEYNSVLQAFIDQYG